MKGPRLSIIPARAVFDPQLSRRDVCVLAAFGIYADKNGRCHASQATIAKRLRMALRAVRKCVAKLKRLGYLEVAQRRHPGGYMRSAEYRITYDGEPPTEQPRQPTSAKDAASDHRAPEALRSPPTIGPSESYHHRTPRVLQNALRRNARSPSLDSGKAPESSDGVSAPSGDPHRSKKKKGSKGTEGRKEGSVLAQPKKVVGVKDLRAVDFEQFAKEHELMVDVERELESFRDWCRAEGRRYKDYRARFRNWLRHEDKYARERRGSGRDGPHSKHGERLPAGTVLGDDGRLRSKWTGELMPQDKQVAK